jgi:uncharacterized paraquat-inducible protein A
MTIQAKCPGCQATLRIPSEWLHKTVRCKRCGAMVRAEKRAPVAAPANPPDPPRIARKPPVPRNR